MAAFYARAEKQRMTHSGLNLLAAAIELFVEVLGIEGVGRSGDAGQGRQSDQGGDDGLHGWYSLLGGGRHHRRPFASHLGLLAPCNRAV